MVVTKKIAAKQKPKANAGATVHTRFTADELAVIDTEVVRAKKAEPAGGVTRSSVLRFLVRELNSPRLVAATSPIASGATWTEGADAIGRYADLTFGSATQRFRWIKPATFTMGSPNGEIGRWDNEGPAHEVTIVSGYWLGDTPVTQALWA